MTARISPAVAPFPAAVSTALERIMPDGVPPLSLFTTLARDERLFSRFFAGALLDQGNLTLRQREIVINRTCALTGCEYEWGVHIAFFAAKAELTPAQVYASVHGAPNDPAWPESEQILLEVTDSLHGMNSICDDLWQRSRMHFSEEQMLEMIMLAGLYHTVSYLANSLKLAPEAFATRFPQNEDT